MTRIKSGACASPARAPTYPPEGSIKTSVGHAFTANARQILNCRSLITGCVTSNLRVACEMFSVRRSAWYLPACTPMMTRSSPKYRSTSRNCESRCMQLIQPYVQKSSTTTLPLSSLNDRGFDTFSQSRPSGNRGVAPEPRKGMCRMFTPHATYCQSARSVDQEFSDQIPRRAARASDSMSSSTF